MEEKHSHFINNLEKARKYSSTLDFIKSLLFKKYKLFLKQIDNALDEGNSDFKFFLDNIATYKKFTGNGIWYWIYRIEYVIFV